MVLSKGIIFRFYANNGDEEQEDADETGRVSETKSRRPRPAVLDPIRNRKRKRGNEIIYFVLRNATRRRYSGRTTATVFR